jgi:N-carbamoyl-L-amino-acid hydrolase
VDAVTAKHGRRLRELRADRDRLWTSLMDMAEVGAVPGGGINRIALTDEDAAGQALFGDWACTAGCRVARDGVGNLFARRRGADPGRPAVLVGSHLDTQPHGGRFDGTVGVLAGLEIVRVLNHAGIETGAPLVVVSWSNEEGARFPLPLTGSSVFAGLLAPSDAEAQRAHDGPTYGEELARLGLAGPGLDEPLEVDSYFELHIEQNTTLERSGTDVGVVERGQGIQALEVRLAGTSAHAGTTKLDDRRDALLTAARIVEHARQLGRATDTLLTVGRLEVRPNSRSVVPGDVTLVVDIRAKEPERLADAADAMRDDISRIAAADGIAVAVDLALEIPVVTFDEACGNAIRRACASLALSSAPLVSGASHDAMTIARIAPAALVFIPCRDGVSHHPAEYSSPDQVVKGCDTLLHAVLERAGAAV